MDDIKMDIKNLRREFHKIAEPGWLEIQTTIKIINYLKSYGYEIKYGKSIHSDNRMGLPSEKIRKEYIDSLDLDVDYDITEILEGYTGVVATLDTGRKGPTIGMRFDIDANDIEESDAEEHIPSKEGFKSENNFAMHACGHDGHISIGLSVAKWIMREKDNLKGKFVIIFQPAEEGVRGAKGMVEKGVVDELDYFLAGHIGLGVESGVLGLGTVGFLSTSKMDIHFKGVSSHAGAAPELGKNALLAAASCSLNLHTLTQFASGMTRLNVGVLNAGSSRNIVPSNATMQIEIRGENEEITDQLNEKVEKVIEGSAKTFDVEYEIIKQGGAPAYNKYDKEFVGMIAAHLEEKGFNIDIARSLGGSEDVTYMMNRVEEKGGKSIHFGFGTELAGAHHNNKFDFEEEALEMAFDALTNTVKLLIQ